MTDAARRQLERAIHRGVALELSCVNRQIGKVHSELLEDLQQRPGQRLFVDAGDDAQHVEPHQRGGVFHHHRGQRPVVRLALEGAGKPKTQQHRLARGRLHFIARSDHREECASCTGSIGRPGYDVLSVVHFGFALATLGLYLSSEILAENMDQNPYYTGTVRQQLTMQTLQWGQCADLSLRSAPASFCRRAWGRAT